MKSILSFLTLFIGFSTIVQAQTSKHVILYGFKQPVVSGASPKVSYSEAGKEKASTSSSKFNYLIYVTRPANVRLYPVEIWLNGAQYGVKFTQIKKLPVQFSNANIPDSKPVILVPKTTKTVLQLNIVKAASQKRLAIAKTKAKSNEAVLVYKMGGKFYYALVKKLTLLEAMYMQ